MSAGDCLSKWRYERGEGRTKHRWRHDHAGFQPTGKGAVGKCPRHVSDELAERLLNEEAIGVHESDDSQVPDCFYAVYRGVVYEAVPTRPGVSYHAYPWRGDLPGRKGLRRWILRELRTRADKRGEREDLERWLKMYGGPGT